MQTSSESSPPKFERWKRASDSEAGCELGGSICTYPWGEFKINKVITIKMRSSLKFGNRQGTSTEMRIIPGIRFPQIVRESEQVSFVFHVIVFETIKKKDFLFE